MHYFADKLGVSASELESSYYIYDDQYNLVLANKDSHEPLYAIYNSIVYDNELTTGLATAYNTYLIKAAKAIDMSIKELNDLALEKHPSRYIPAKYR